MIKYIFNLIAIILTLATWIYVYSLKNKKCAMLKVVYVGISSLYLIIQMFLYFKVCRYIPKELGRYSYRLQSLCLGGFVLVMLIYTLVNAYITRIQKKEDESIYKFKEIRKQLEECTVIIENDEIREIVTNLCDKVRYLNPVCHGVEQEEMQIFNLIQELKRDLPKEKAQKICEQIDKLLELRKIRQTKE